jgi:ribosomal protein L11 methyltransferase
MAQSQLSVPLTKEQAYSLVDAVMELDELALTASAHEDENGEWVFEATCENEPDIEAFNELAEKVLGGKVGFTASRIDPDTDWVSKSLEGLKPVQAGGFYVYGSHDSANVPTGLTPLHIDAAQAFGTGHHETTTGCLEAIDRLLKRKKPQNMLDVGTGTGILAIALAKRTRLPVIASDIDPVCVSTTVANAELNQVRNDIICVEAAGLDHRLISDNSPYDLIVANILAGPLAKLAPAIGRAAAPGASIILSGILVPQAARIKAAYGQQDMVFKSQITKNNWVTLTFEKARASKRRF